jgi:hypothetical protein
VPEAVPALQRWLEEQDNLPVDRGTVTLSVSLPSELLVRIGGATRAAVRAALLRALHDLRTGRRLPPPVRQVRPRRSRSGLKVVVCVRMRKEEARELRVLAGPRAGQ